MTHLPKHPIQELMSHRPRAHRVRRASHLYNDSWRDLHLSEVSSVIDTKRTMLASPRRLPSWLWTGMCFLFGISDNDDRRPIIATFLAMFTLSAALLFAITSSYYIYYDVISTKTKSTVFTGMADVILGLAWAMIGVYANDLSRRILRNKGLVNNIRLHTRTFFRMNGALLVTLTALTALGIHIYVEFESFKGSNCAIINLNRIVCKLRFVSNVANSTMVVVWNLIVAFLAMSMCRTFTIVCRRFIRELEQEGKIQEKIYRLRMLQRSKELEEVGGGELLASGLGTHGALWDSQNTVEIMPSVYMDSVGDLSEEEEVEPPLERSRGPTLHVVAPSAVEESSPETSNRLSGDNANAPNHELRTIGHESIEARPSRVTIAPEYSRNKSHSRSHSDSNHQRVREERDIVRFEKLLFTEEDLCMRFWKINCQLRIASLVFQRWFATWIAFVAFWAFSYIVYWLNHKASFLELAYFFLPILLVAVVSASYAEVNLESSRIIYSVCPRAGRLQFNRFVGSQPAYLMVFAMPMTYQVITGFVLAFTIAFASRIVMDEFNKV